MSKVRVISKKNFDVTIMETGVIIPKGISIMDESDAIKKSEFVKILNRIEPNIKPKKITNEPNDENTETLIISDDVEIKKTDISSITPIKHSTEKTLPSVYIFN
jgi:hypothetical protein